MTMGWRLIDEDTPRDGETWVDLWRPPGGLSIMQACRVTAVWYEGAWCWPAESIVDHYSERGRRLALNAIEAGDCYEDVAFTHWMPLPAPPTARNQEE